MLKFLRKEQKPNVNMLKFPTFDWAARDKTNHFRSWVKDDHSAFIGIELYDEPFPVEICDTERLITIARNTVVEESGGGLINCEVVQIAGWDFIRIVQKEPLEVSGVNYVAKLILPLKAGHIVLMIKICENGTTGVRDSIILQKWIQENGDIESDENGIIIGWVEDPYNADFREGRPMNISEKEEYDSNFPDHPLSELRAKLKEVEGRLQIDPRLR